MRCRFDLREWTTITGLKRFSLKAWKALSGLKKFTLKAWCDFIEQGEQPAPYHADAVHFDGSTYLDNNNLTSVTSPHAAGSFWVKMDQASIDDERIIQQAGGGAGVAVNVQFDGSLRINAAASGGSQVSIISDAGVIVANTWVNVRFNVNTATQVGAVYAGLDDVTDTVTPTGVGADMSMNGKDIGVPDLSDDEYAITGDMADHFFRIGTAMDMAFAADGATFITAGGKPKDPSGFPSAAVLFSGDATGYVTNQGTGGAFTLTGSLTNASTSPSD